MADPTDVWTILFQDPSLPRDQQATGGCYVRGMNPMAAWENSFKIGCNPGPEHVAMGGPVPGAAVPRLWFQTWGNRQLTRAQIEAASADLIEQMSAPR